MEAEGGGLRAGFRIIVDAGGCERGGVVGWFWHGGAVTMAFLNEGNLGFREAKLGQVDDHLGGRETVPAVMSVVQTRVW